MGASQRLVDLERGIRYYRGDGTWLREGFVWADCSLPSFRKENNLSSEDEARVEQGLEFWDHSHLLIAS